MQDARVARALKQQLMADAMLGVEQVPWRVPDPGSEYAQLLVQPTEPSTQQAAPQRNPVASTSGNDPSASVGGRGPSSRTGFAPAPAARPAHTAQPSLQRPPAIKLEGDTKAAKLEALRENLLANQTLADRCPPGTKLVFGEGDPDAKIMFVGEGPGQVEAEQGRPFVGPAGQLLEKMINAMGLKREDVYITNMVNFRPPNNRVPMPEEVVLCDPYLIGQIKTVSPQAIVCLGGTATKNMLETSTGITRLRGSWVQYSRVTPPIDLMPTFHPAFLLRSYTKDNRAKVWSDLQQVMKKVGMEID